MQLSDPAEKNPEVAYPTDDLGWMFHNTAMIFRHNSSIWRSSERCWAVKDDTKVLLQRTSRCRRPTTIARIKPDEASQLPLVTRMISVVDAVWLTSEEEEEVLKMGFCPLRPLDKLGQARPTAREGDLQTHTRRHSGPCWWIYDGGSPELGGDEP